MTGFPLYLPGAPLVKDSSCDWLRERKMRHSAPGVYVHFKITSILNFIGFLPERISLCFKFTFEL